MKLCIAFGRSEGGPIAIITNRLTLARDPSQGQIDAGTRKCCEEQDFQTLGTRINHQLYFSKNYQFTKLRLSTLVSRFLLTFEDRAKIRRNRGQLNELQNGGYKF
jgi:hypothetical protein